MVLERFNAVGASINETRRENENRDRGIALEFRNIRERDIKNVYDSMNSRFDSLETKTDSRFDAMESQMDPMQVLFRNSKVYHVTQKVTPLSGYDRLPVPKCFPKTAYELICLKDEKNCQWKYLAPVLHCG